MRRVVLLFAAVLLVVAMVSCGDSNTTNLPTVSAIAYVHVNGGTPASTFLTKRSLSERDSIERQRPKLSITTGTQFSINTMNVDGTNIKTIVTTDEYIYGVDLSRDGKKITYMGYDDATGYDQVFLLDVATKQSTRLTTSSSYKYDAMFTPDGSYVIFRAYSETTGNAELWKIGVSSGTETKIATSTTICLHEPHVSLDGTQVVFDYHDDTHSDAIGIVKMDGTGFTTVPNTTYVYTPALSAAKTSIFYADWYDDMPQVHSVKSDGTGATLLVDSGASIDPYPVGSKVLFVWDTTGDYTDLDIYSMDSDGSNPKKLTSGGLNYMHWYGLD